MLNLGTVENKLGSIKVKFHVWFEFLKILSDLTLLNPRSEIATKTPRNQSRSAMRPYVATSLYQNFNEILTFDNFKKMRFH